MGAASGDHAPHPTGSTGHKAELFSRTEQHHEPTTIDRPDSPMNTSIQQHPTVMQRLAQILPFLVIAMVLGAFATPAEAQRARTRTPPPQQQTDDPETTKKDDPETKPGDPATPPPAEARPSQPSQQAEQGEAAPKPVLKPTPFLTTRNPKQWNLRAEVVIRRVESILNRRTGEQELHVVDMDFTSATIVFPVLPSSSSHRMDMREVDGIELPDLTGQITLNDRPVPQDMSFIQRGVDGKPLPSNTWRAQWFVAQPSGAGFSGVREMNLKFEVPVEAFETQFDEQAATRVPWPDGPWPEEALAALQPEAYIEYNPDGNAVHSTEEIDRLLSVWLEGNDPQKLPPVTLAKWLAGKVVEHVQPSGDGLAFDQRTNMFTGFNLQSVPATAVSGRGSPFDMNNLLVAVYRRAGLPARVVIGFDTASARSGRTIYERSRNRPNLRVWTEFCLYDAKNQTLGWIPVDVVEMRKSSSRLPPRFLERPQKYFGTHDDLSDVIPLAHHYAPAQTSVWFYNYPAFWGWFVQPSPPNVGSQTIRFDASRAARRSNR